MNAIEKRARQLLEDMHLLRNEEVKLEVLIAALTPTEGHVVVTRNEADQAVAVTRQDDYGRILSVIAEFEIPSGYVLVPVGQDPVDFYVCDACGHHYMEDGVTCDCTPDAVQPPLRHVRMLAARPEVP